MSCETTFSLANCLELKRAWIIPDLPQLHFSIIRNDVVPFGAKTAQDLALIKTPHGWHISSGDAAQLEGRHMVTALKARSMKSSNLNIKPGETVLPRLRELKDHDLLQNNGGAAELLIKEP